MRSITFHLRFAAVLLALGLAAIPPVPAVAATALEQRNPLWPSNFSVERSQDAQTVPTRFYRAIDGHDYQTALSLLTPRTKETYEEMASTQYFVSLKHISVNNLQDITKQAGPLRKSADQYAAVKVYLGKVQAASTDSKQQTLLNQWPYHRFVVVETVRGGPWLLDDDEAMTQKAAYALWPHLVRSGKPESS